MKVEQLAVFLENTSGRLSEITGILSEAGINIRALSLADTSDFGVLRMLVSDTDAAEAALRRHGVTARKTEVLAVEVEDRPGGLHHILDLLATGGINVEYMYAFVQHSGRHAVMIFRLDQPAAGMELLTRKGVKVIDGQQLYAM
jgi:hypothetical protein